MLLMEDDRLATFGQALRGARTAARLNQGDLGGMVGVTASAVGNWERGEDEPRRGVVGALEVALGLAPGDLSVHLGYRPTDVADSLDVGDRIAQLPADDRKTVMDLVDMLEQRRNAG